MGTSVQQPAAVSGQGRASEAAPALHKRPWFPDAVAVVLLFLLASAYTWIRVGMTGTYFRGDILTQFLPYYTENASRLRSGDIPGWNPALFSGMPFAGDPISGWTYLPITIPFLLFQTLTAYKFSVLFHLSAATIATYALGRTLHMGPIGAATAAIAFLLSPHYHYSQCCTARMQLGPWIPLGMLTIELGLRSRQWWTRALCWTATGLIFWQIIAGYFGKGMYYGILLLGAWLAYRTLIDPPLPAPHWRSRVAAFALHATAVLALGAAFSAVVLLPRLSFMNDANLKGGTYEVIAPGAVDPPAWTLGRALSILFDPSRPTYFIGAATVAIAIAGVILAGRRYAAPFFALFSIAVVTLTLETTLFHRLMYFLPRFEDIHIHEPQRVLVVLNIGPAMLAGAAVAALEARAASWKRMLFAAAGALALSGVILLIIRADNRPSNTRLIEAAAIISAILVAGVLIRHASQTQRPHRWLPAAMAGALLLTLLVNLDQGRLWDATRQGWRAQPVNDLGAAYSDQHDTGGAGAFLLEQQETGGPFRYFGYNSAFLSLADDAMEDNYRRQWTDLLAAQLLVNNRALALGLQDIQGYNPVQEMNYLTFINAINGQVQEYHETNILPSGLQSPLLPLLNARYIVIPSQPAQTDDFRYLLDTYPVVFDNGTVKVLEMTDSLPRAWTVHDVRQVTEAELLPLLAGGNIDPRVTALLTTPPPAVQPLGDGAADQVTMTRYDEDQIELEVSMASDGLLILSEVFDSGWQARINGESVTIHQADGLLRAVTVPAGTHSLVLRYAPPALRNGIIISSSTLAISFVAVLLLWRFPTLPAHTGNRLRRWRREPSTSG